MIFPESANRAPSQTTSTTKRPGRNTCAASSSDCGSATRTPAPRTSWDSPVAVEEPCSPPIPRSTRSPADGVGAERGELPDLVALVALARLQRLEHGPMQQHEHGHADQHDEAERRPTTRAG